MKVSAVRRESTSGGSWGRKDMTKVNKKEEYGISQEQDSEKRKNDSIEERKKKGKEMWSKRKDRKYRKERKGKEKRKEREKVRDERGGGQSKAET